MPENPPIEIEHWPWPIKIYTLGRFSILIDGKLLKFKRKTQQRPLELLKALIALGGHAVFKERLIDALWPEAEGDAGEQTFAMTLHRLRTIIGHGAIKREGSRLTFDNRLVWTDIWVVERLLNNAKRIGADHPEAGPFIEKITSFYQGSFLKYEETRPWMLPTRERLRDRLKRCLLLRRRHLSKIGAHDAAREVDDEMIHGMLEVDGGV